MKMWNTYFLFTDQVVGGFDLYCIYEKVNIDANTGSGSSTLLLALVSTAVLGYGPHP
jgi:hypothetical protein